MNKYSIWNLEYAYVTNYHMSGIIYGAHNEGFRKLPYCYTVIKGNGHTIMVDTGYKNEAGGKEMADMFGVTGWHAPEEVLGEVGVKPDDVDMVFITHSHFDHLGNLPAFKNAVFYMQEAELDAWVKTMSLPTHLRWPMVAVDPDDILRAVELAKQGRMVLMNGDLLDVVPGIDLFAAIDTHTPGSMYVRVRNSGDDLGNSWIIAGDLVYSYEQFGGRPNAEGVFFPVGLATGSQQKLVDVMNLMVEQVGGDYKKIIPIHEVALKDIFPSRLTDKGLQINEICLADGESSKVK
jgi:N-acyl homoserine lactone hydrolase